MPFTNSEGSGLYGWLRAYYNDSYPYSGYGTYSNSYGTLAGYFMVADENYAPPTFNLMEFARSSNGDPGAGSMTTLYSFTVTVKFLPVRTY